VGPDRSRWRRLPAPGTGSFSFSDHLPIGKLYRHWPRARQVQHLDAYVRRILVRTWLDEKARVWRREEPAETLPESPVLPTDEVVERLGLLEPLDALLDPGLTLYP
jgi:hypothetical protein